MKTWLITGCSAGVGKSLARAVLRKGNRVVVTARKVDSLVEFGNDFPDTALILPLDVTDEDAIKDAVKKAKQKFGGIDDTGGRSGKNAFQAAAWDGCGYVCRSCDAGQNRRICRVEGIQLPV